MITRIFADNKYSKQPVTASCREKPATRDDYNLLNALESSKLSTRYGDIYFTDAGNKPGYQAINMKVTYNSHLLIFEIVLILVCRTYIVKRATR